MLMLVSRWKSPRPVVGRWTLMLLGWIAPFLKELVGSCVTKTIDQLGVVVISSIPTDRWKFQKPSLKHLKEVWKGRNSPVKVELDSFEVIKLLEHLYSNVYEVFFFGEEVLIFANYVNLFPLCKIPKEEKKLSIISQLWHLLIGSLILGMS